MTTGSTVKGMVAGMQKHLGGADIMFVVGDPDGVVNPVQENSSPSGGVVAFDTDDNQLYFNETGSTWYKLGSVA